MKILLTGATGFVGRQIARALLSNDHEVHLIVRNLEKLDKDLAAHAHKITTSPDIFSESAQWWQEVCNCREIVIHSAWYAEPGQYLNSPKNIDCLIGTLNMAKGATAAGVSKFVGVGTCFEYDFSPGILSTDTPLLPLSPYAGAKVGAFNALSHYFTTNNTEFLWCRLFYLYGEGEDDRKLVAALHKKLAAGEEIELTSGKQIRDFMDIVDAGTMIADLATSRASGPANVCTGTPVTVRELAERVADKYGRRDLLKFGARADNPLDPPKILGIPTKTPEN